MGYLFQNRKPHMNEWRIIFARERRSHAPAHHISQFYDYLYLNALLEPENEAVRNQLLQEEYTAFSDLARKSLNYQARSAAIFVGLVKAGLIDEVARRPTISWI